MAEISELDWAHHIKMDYTQNLRKDHKRAKIKTLVKFLHVIAKYIVHKNAFLPSVLFLVPKIFKKFKELKCQRVVSALWNIHSNLSSELWKGPY